MSDDSGAETSRVLMWIGLALLVVLLFGFPFWGWDSDWGFFGGFFALIFFFPILLIVLIVVLVVAIANGSRRQPPLPAQTAVSTTFTPATATQPRESLAILERRYAEGKLTRTEYLRMRDDLR